MKEYTVTSKNTGKYIDTLTEEELQKLAAIQGQLERKYIIAEVPARKPVPKPEELSSKVIEPDETKKRVAEPKTKKYE